MAHQKTAVIDFDNTLAGYDKWRGENVLGPPIPYAVDAVRELSRWGWRIVVFTTRRDRRAIDEWLVEHGFGSFNILVNSTSHNPPNASNKPIAEVYFDDRDAHVVQENPYNWHKAMKRVRRLYQPRLDTCLDDACVWASWPYEWIVAPRRRRIFRRSLHANLEALSKPSP